MKEIGSDIVDLLNSEAKRINNIDFIEKDPVQFPRRFSRLEDIEITAFLSAIIAWGKREMICRDAERLLNLMDNQPYNYVMDEGYLDLDPKQNIHRTLFAEHLQYFLRGLRRIYKDYGSIDGFGRSKDALAPPRRQLTTQAAGLKAYGADLRKNTRSRKAQTVALGPA